MKDKNVKKEEKELNVDFTGFSQKQDNVVVNNDRTNQSDAKSHVSFHEFDETAALNDSKSKKGKKQFDEYFEQGRATQSELEKEKPKSKKQEKPKRIKRKKQKEIEDFDDIKKRRAYKFKRKKYTKVEDFITFLNDNFLDLDEIADTILADENFHGWLKKKSKRFDESISDFRDIIEKIGN